MEIIKCQQGSDLWLSIRAKHFTASEAPAAMGVSKYQTRGDLLYQKATGFTPNVDAAKQRLFDAGHMAEAVARQIVEEQIGEDLFPCTGTLEVDGLSLLASFDGLTMGGEIVWETKLWSEELAEAIEGGDLAAHYWAQIEQQLLVSGAEKAYFTASDGTPERTVGMWYVSVPERRAQLIASWKQFEADLFAYEPPEIIPAAVATPTMQLPALSIQVNGSITLIDNLKVFGEKLESFVAGLDKNPSDDQAFADAEAAVKTLQKAEEALKAAESSALAQTSSIDDMRRTVALYADLARTNRLMLEKLVKARKETIRVEIMQAGQHAFNQHAAGLNKRLGGNYMPAIIPDFSGVMRAKKTILSLRGAVDDELARCKILANETADRIQINLATLKEKAADFMFLFPDVSQIVLKPSGDCMDTINARIAAHKEAESKKEADTRERIRQEELARIEREEAEDRAKKLIEQQEAQKRAKAVAEANVPANLSALAVAPVSPSLEQFPPASPVDTGATMNLGEINAILDITVSAEFLSGLGFRANCKVYRACDFPAICTAIILHIDTVAGDFAVREAA